MRNSFKLLGMVLFLFVMALGVVVREIRDNESPPNKLEASIISPMEISNVALYSLQKDYIDSGPSYHYSNNLYIKTTENPILKTARRLPDKYNDLNNKLYLAKYSAIKYTNPLCQLIRPGWKLNKGNI